MENNIGNARRRYARSHGRFTQADAASALGVSTSAYRKWEQGTGMLNGVQLCQLADLYGVSVDYLLLRTDEPTGHASDIPADVETLSRMLLRRVRLNEEGTSRLAEYAALLDASNLFKE